MVKLYHFIHNEMIWKSRWSKDQIQTILFEQADMFWKRDFGIQREKMSDVKKASELPHAVIISGLRRVGKSTLLAQLAHSLGKDAFYYLNFEDDCNFIHSLSESYSRYEWITPFKLLIN